MIVHLDSTRYIWEVLENQEYAFLFEGLEVLDLGCNIGAFSLWIYPRAKRIYAVDQDLTCINHFNDTIRDNDLKNVKTFHTAIRNEDTLASFMSGNGIKHIDVLKMDIEGDELSVVEAKDFPAYLINAIIGELHYQDQRRDAFAWRLTELGYRYTELPNNHFIARK